MGNISLLNTMLSKTVEKWDAESIPVFVNKKVLQKGVKKVNTFNTQ